MILSRRLALGLAGAAALAPAARAAKPAHEAGANESGASAAPAAFTCGAALPLSGAAALQGDEALRGIQLAIDAVNAAGGIAGLPLTLVTADMPSPAEAGAVVNGLITSSHAGMMFGSGDSALSLPATAAAELAQMPFIELTAPADGICTRGFKYLLRTGPSTQMAAQLAVQTLQARFAGRKLGLLYNSSVTGSAFAGALNAALGAAKLQLTLSVGYPEGGADLHDEAGRLMRAGVEVLLHVAGPDGALAWGLATHGLNWQPKALIGYGAGYGYRQVAAALPDAFTGAYVIAAPFYPDQAETVQAAYLARYGTAPRAADSLTAYAGAKLVFDTLGGVDGDAGKLLGALRQAHLPAGAMANGFAVQFDHNGQNTGAYVTLQQWRGGVLAPV
ncbi:MAG TPA: ABC transporter substrate-binding protein [Acidocella sp.]|jgi:branched-chain amino acid transport system substrate-binding protein|nr:ABC transporter substrate-binding protein [Acidocella sp.]